jgi:hypothetical protein
VVVNALTAHHGDTTCGTTKDVDDGMAGVSGRHEAWTHRTMNMGEYTREGSTAQYVRKAAYFIHIILYIL